MKERAEQALSQAARLCREARDLVGDHHFRLRVALEVAELECVRELAIKAEGSSGSCPAPGPTD